MKPSFESTVDILVKAYFNGTLEHMSCTKCAVGNIVAARTDIGSGEWFEVVNDLFSFNPHRGEEQIKATGYSIQELRQIEIAFEVARFGNGDLMFNGLMAVVDVLADIHGIDLTEKEEAKKLFVKLT